MPALTPEPTARQWRLPALAIVTLLLLTASLPSFADEPAIPPFLNAIGESYRGNGIHWGTTIRTHATRLFMLLASIDFAWMCVTFILEKKELDDMMMGLVKKLMTLSFFLFLLMTSGTWMPQIIDSFTNIGREAAGLPSTRDAAAAALVRAAAAVITSPDGTNTVDAIIAKTVDKASPDGIAAEGFDTAVGVFQILRELELSQQAVAGLPASMIALMIFLSFLIVAAQLLVVQIESYIVIGGGVIMLGFGGSRWTTDLAAKYMRVSVGIGVKLMVLYLVVGAGQMIFADFVLQSGSEFFPTMLRALGMALVYAYLAVQIPAIASSMVTGSPSLSAGGLLSAASNVGSAAGHIGAAAGAALRGGAGAAGGAAVSATGVGKAIGAGLDPGMGMDMGKGAAALAVHAIGPAGRYGLGLAAGTIGDRIAGAADSAGGQPAAAGATALGTDASGAGDAGGADAAAALVAAPARGVAGAPATLPAGLAAQTGAAGADSPAGAAASAAPPAASDAQAARPQAGDPGRAPSLAPRTQALSGYVPDEAVQAAKTSIDMKHKE